MRRREEGCREVLSRRRTSLPARRIIFESRQVASRFLLPIATRVIAFVEFSANYSIGAKLGSVRDSRFAVINSQTFFFQRNSSPMCELFSYCSQFRRLFSAISTARFKEIFNGNRSDCDDSRPLISMNLFFTLLANFTSIVNYDTLLRALSI